MFLRLFFIFTVLMLAQCTQAERDNIHDPGSTDYCYGCYSSSDKISSSSSISISSSSIDDSSSSIEEISSISEFIYGSLQDSRDGKTYKTIAIGEQTWMAENLNYEIDGSKCYNDSISYCEKYGRLYEWNSATDICPEGWYLPGDKEWEDLIVYVSPDAGKKLKATIEWRTEWSWSSISSTDDYGFTALPGGRCNSKNQFSNISGNGYWWSATEVDLSYAYNRYMHYGEHSVSREYNSKTDLFSVRCIEGISNYRYYCGGNEYIPIKQFCYNNIAYIKCNNDTYDPTKWVCVNDVLMPKCGNNYYNDEIEFCYNNSIYIKCNSDTYDLTKWVCVNDVLMPKCGDNYYDSSIEFCYSSRLVGQICEENNSYNPSIYGCDNGVLKRRCGSSNDVYYDIEIEFCTADYEVKNKEVFTDSRDGKTYKYVEIGEQIWMAENLNYEVDGSLCYNNLDDNCIKYGRLYYWETAIIACPEDWHLPSDDEWKTLIDYASPDEGTKLISVNYNSTDIYGFSALPSGYSYSTNSFSFINNGARWWNATEDTENLSYYYSMYINSINFNRSTANKTNGYSVRCVKD